MNTGRAPKQLESKKKEQVREKKRTEWDKKGREKEKKTEEDRPRDFLRSKSILANQAPNGHKGKEKTAKGQKEEDGETGPERKKVGKKGQSLKARHGRKLSVVGSTLSDGRKWGA